MASNPRDKAANEYALRIDVPTKAPDSDKLGGTPLAFIHKTRDPLVANEGGLAAARNAAQIARARFDAGASDYLGVLDAERTLLDFEDRVVQGSVARATSLAALYKALAGDFARAP